MPLISLMKFFTSLNSISNVFQEPHDFLIFTVDLYISSRSRQSKLPCKNTDGCFPDQGNSHSLTNSSKLLKWDLVYLLNTFGDPSLRIFATEKAYLVLIKNEFEVWRIQFRRTVQLQQILLGVCVLMSPFSLNHAENQISNFRNWKIWQNNEQVASET